MELTAMALLEEQGLGKPLLVVGRSAPIPNENALTDSSGLKLAKVEAAKQELIAYKQLAEEPNRTIQEEGALLKYVLKAKDGNLVGLANWDPAAETEDSMELWFRSFGDKLIREIPDRLVLLYNSTTGGCVDEPPDVDVFVTQLESFVGQYSTKECFLQSLDPSSAPSEVPSSKPSFDPSSSPSQKPSAAPRAIPSAVPTPMPTKIPGGTAVWAQEKRVEARYSDFVGTDFGSIITGPDIRTRWSFMRGAVAPTRDEKIVVGVTDEGSSSKITAIMWDGNTWSRITINGVGDLLGSVSLAYWNNADVAYEAQSGDAVLVWNDNKQSSSNMLRYSVWNGKTWTTAASISGVSGEPMWFDITSNPRSDEIVLATSDSSNSVYVAVWDGSRWSNGPFQISTDNHNAGIAVAHESQSGHAMVVYRKSIGASDIFYRTWNGSTWSGEASL